MQLQQQGQQQWALPPHQEQPLAQAPAEARAAQLRNAAEKPQIAGYNAGAGTAAGQDQRPEAATK